MIEYSCNTDGYKWMVINVDVHFVVDVDVIDSDSEDEVCGSQQSCYPKFARYIDMSLIYPHIISLSAVPIYLHGYYLTH